MDTYKLWKDNRIDQEFTVEREELVGRMEKWLAAKGVHYVNYYSTERLIRFFITDQGDNGMSSVFNELDFVAFVEDLAPVIRDYEKSHAKPTN